LLKNNL